SHLSRRDGCGDRLAPPPFLPACVSVGRFVRVFVRSDERNYRGEHIMLCDKTTEVLEWKKLLALLAGHTRSTRGAARARSGVLSSDLAAARRLQQLTTEMTEIQAWPDPMPLMVFPDVEEAVGRAGKGAVLE